MGTGGYIVALSGTISTLRVDDILTCGQDDIQAVGLNDIRAFQART